MRISLLQFPPLCRVGVTGLKRSSTLKKEAFLIDHTYGEKNREIAHGDDEWGIQQKGYLKTSNNDHFQ
jgi:hypothetical protein